MEIPIGRRFPSKFRVMVTSRLISNNSSLAVRRLRALKHDFTRRRGDGEEQEGRQSTWGAYTFEGEE